jgi:folate-binding protein YgfZ
MSTPTATRIERDVVVVTGADAGEYLQTQLSQDVLSIEVSESAWSFLLTPKSEIVALMRVTRSGDEEFILDMEPGWGDTVRRTIDEFLGRMDVCFDQATWPGVAWRGNAPEPVDAPICADNPWMGVVGLDVVGPDVQMPADATEAAWLDLEQTRIGSGWPSMSADIAGTVTPAMTGLVAQTVGFEKGCYTGQEFVARVHYRGADPPRRLVRLTFDDDTTLAPGAPIIVDAVEVGEVTSMGRGVALGYLKRGCETPSAGLVGNVGVRLLATQPQ